MILLFPPVLQKRRGELGGSLDYLIDWVLFRIDCRVRGLVQLAPTLEQPLERRHGVAGQQRPIRRCRTQAQGGRRGRYSKVYGMPGGRHKYPDSFVRDPAAARSNYSRGTREVRGCVRFQLAEAGLAVVGKDAGDRFAGFRFDDEVEVYKWYSETFRYRLSDSGFAGTGEAEEKNGAQRRGRRGAL